MKILIDKAAIENAAQMLSKVIATKHVVPILGDILCEVKGDSMAMTASDNEIRLKTTIALNQSDGDGSFCVPSRRLTDALMQMPDGDITFIIEDGVLTIKTGSGETYFPTDNADEYPLPTSDEMGETITIDGDLLTGAIKRSLWAAANDGIRVVMNSIFFAMNDGHLEVVASNGMVLAKSQYTMEAESDRQFIMPKKVAGILQGMLPNEPINIEWGNNWARMEFAQNTMTFRLIEGPYPKYNVVIPTNQPLGATVYSLDILTALRRVLPFGASDSRMVKLEFTEGKLTVRAEDTCLAMGAHDTINTDYHQQPMTIGISGGYLCDLITKLETDRITIQFGSPDKPLTICPAEQSEGCKVTMLQMPMKLA